MRGSLRSRQLLGIAVAHLLVHGAELQHLDQLVVEAVALLPEQHRPRAVELDEQRDRQHDRRDQRQDERAEQAVLDGLGDPPPVAQRTIDDVQEGVAADVARLQRAETHGEFAGAEPHVDGNEAELVQRLDQQVVARSTAARR